MNDHTIIKRGNPFTLLKLTHATYQPFVVAFNYDETDGTWGQGHYFAEYQAACDYQLAENKRMEEYYK